MIFSPDYLFITMANAGVDPASSLYIGDMSIGHQATNRLGIDCLHENWDYETPVTNNNIDSIKKLLVFFMNKGI
jgi:phosphoglycolate phosphatase/pyrophosphatase PpaX